jgi:hypothetical protein
MVNSRNNSSFPMTSCPASAGLFLGSATPEELFQQAYVGVAAVSAASMTIGRIISLSRGAAISAAGFAVLGEACPRRFAKLAA